MRETLLASFALAICTAAVGAQAPDEDGPTPPLGAPTVEKLYADAVALGFGDKQVVDADFSALVARAESYQLQRIYADAVLANAEPLSVVRQSLRELGYRREVWEEWPAKKANVLYALSIVSGGEQDSMLRERLYAIRDRGVAEPPVAAAEEGGEEGKVEGLGSVSQPSKSNDDNRRFCGADCGQDDPEHPFYWVYETDMYQEWKLWYEWFHGGPCPSCWTVWELVIDVERIQAVISEACTISDELSLVGNLQTLYTIIVTNPDSAVGKYWRKKLLSWAKKAGIRAVLSNVTGVGALINTVSTVCWIRRSVEEEDD